MVRNLVGKTRILSESHDRRLEAHVEPLPDTPVVTRHFLSLKKTYQDRHG
jgi:hypothetical protein